MKTAEEFWESMPDIVKEVADKPSFILGYEFAAEEAKREKETEQP